MSKKQKFVDFVAEIMSPLDPTDIDPDVMTYWKAFKGGDEKEKPLFTDNGKIVLKFLLDHQERDTWKSKDIADIIGISSRTVSGAMRKLVNDEYVEKLGQDPVIYSLTDKGKNVIFED